MKKLTLVLLALSSVALAMQRPTSVEPWDAYLPEENTDPESTSYASSRVCRSCHPAEYDSWYASYHRTMTQWASEASIIPSWDGVDFGFNGRSHRLFRRDGLFFVDMPRHGTSGARAEDRPRAAGAHDHGLPSDAVLLGSRCRGRYPETTSPVRRNTAVTVRAVITTMPTGGALEGATLPVSALAELWDVTDYHPRFDGIGPSERDAIGAYLERIQFPGRIVQFPFVYFAREKRWLHDSYTFLQPEEPYSSVEPYGKNWNGNCDACHTTAPDYGWDAGEALGQTELAELGIACEACHGPGREHVERHKNPLRRYRAHLGSSPPSDIVNPAKLDPAAGASVCAQCHAELVPKERREAFRPGDAIESFAHVLRRTDPPQSRMARRGARGRAGLVSKRVLARRDHAHCGT